MVSKALAKSKVHVLLDVVIPALHSTATIHLSIPSISFLVTKIYKPFGINIGNRPRGPLNGSHSVLWVKIIRDIMQYLVDND